MSLLEIKNLTIHYIAEGGDVKAVNDVSLSIDEGETLGLVGETGAGKTTTALGILNLIQSPPGKILSGEIIYKGKDLLKLSRGELLNIRGSQISMIFQDPMTALNPVHTIGDQIAEVIELHEGCGKKEAAEKAKDMLEKVGISRVRAGDYPHQLSGGMKQRVVIAIALACDPALLLADEPTTALDVTIQAQVLNLLKQLQQDRGIAFMFITHDMSVVKHISHDIMVMYMGRAVEKCDARELFRNPVHPYTAALLSAIPVPSIHQEKKRIIIQGEITTPIDPKPGCRFAARCPYATQRCYEEEPAMTETSPGHFVSCHVKAGA